MTIKHDKLEFKNLNSLLNQLEDFIILVPPVAFKSNGGKS